MSLTLLEAAKLNSGDVYLQGIVQKFAETSDLLRVLPFRNISGNSLKYNIEEKLSGVGFRGINESFDESTGILNPQSESLTISGGDFDVDSFIIQTQGSEQRTVQEALKAKALALAWTKTFVKGDSIDNPREFDGLQTRIQGDALLENHATGAGLSLLKLDEAIDNVEGATHILMNKTMRRNLTVAARTQAVGGNITYVLNDFGVQVTYYNDTPILIMDKDNNNDDILGFTESDDTTSIYVLAIGEGQVEGLQNGGVTSEDIGQLETKPVYRTRVSWFSTFGIFAPRTACRLSKITNAAVTA